jgi:RNA-directed DNA polymerase
MSSRREGDAGTRAEKPERPREASGGTAHGLRNERQAHAAHSGAAGDEARRLIDEVLRHENMAAAHARVVSNGGAPGIDGMTVEALGEHCREHWPRIRQELLDGTYQPQAVRRVEIPKAEGGVRTLGIPTVLDRMIQQALHQVLSPIFDPTFSDGSFGFRPGRGTHDAVVRAREHIAVGYRWVVDLDLAKFFDTVNHDVLIATRGAAGEGQAGAPADRPLPAGRDAGRWRDVDPDGGHAARRPTVPATVQHPAR